MKKISHSILIFLACSCLPAFLTAQTCSGGGAAATVTLSLAGLESVNGLGDPANASGTLISPIVGDVVGRQSTGINFTLAGGGNKCFHPEMSFTNPSGVGVTYRPSTITGTNCTDLPTSSFADYNTLGFIFPTGPAGEINWELFEDTNNGSGADATYTSGTVTLYVCPTGQVLPIELRYFNAKALANSNMLNWATASERNVAAQVVERSANGTSDWKTLHRIAGEGDSQTEKLYHYEDAAPLAKAYYRLRIIDRDGKEQLSDITPVIRRNEGFGLLELFPNPVKDNLTVQFNVLTDGMVEIRITDITGRMVVQQQSFFERGVNTQNIPAEALEGGVYFMSLFSEGNAAASEPVRFVKQ